MVGTGEAGAFVVEDWCTAGIPKQAKAPDMEVSERILFALYVAFGLHLSSIARTYFMTPHDNCMVL